MRSVTDRQPTLSYSVRYDRLKPYMLHYYRHGPVCGSVGGIAETTRLRGSNFLQFPHLQILHSAASFSAVLSILLTSGYHRTEPKNRFQQVQSRPLGDYTVRRRLGRHIEHRSSLASELQGAWCSCGRRRRGAAGLASVSRSTQLTSIARLTVSVPRERIF